MSSKAQKKKGWLLPDDINDILGAELVMFCGLIPNEEHAIAALDGAVRSVTYWWNWQKTDGREAADVAIYMRQVLECFVIDCCSKMQACIGETIAPILKKNADDLLKELQDLYDQQGTAGVAPDLVYDNTEQDLKRDILVCFMCRAFVDFICDAEIQRRRENLADAFWAVNIINQVAILSLPILAPISPWIALAAAVGNAILLLAQPLSELAEEILLDQTARENVACCMYSALAGATPSYTRFATSLDGCGFSPIQNSEFIRNAIQPLVEDVDVYLTFLGTAQDIAPYVDQGLLDACPCDDFDWAQLHNFTVEAYDYGTVGDLATGACEYRDVAYDAAGYWKWIPGMTPGMFLAIRLPAGTIINRMVVDVEIIGYNGGNGFAVGTRDDDCVSANELFRDNSWNEGGRYIRDCSFGDFVISDEIVGLNIDCDTPTEIRIHSITWYGKGVNPFTPGQPSQP